MNVGLRTRQAWVASAAATLLLAADLAVPAVSAAAPATPAFVQQASAHAKSKTSLSVTPASAVAAGDRLVVEVVVRNTSGATAASVADTAGDTFTEVLSKIGSDGTELSVWTTVAAGGSSTPVITATPTAKANIGIAVAEYSGLSAAAGSGSVDASAAASGRTTAAGTVSAGPTTATSAANDLVIGFYGDLGANKALGAGSGYTARTNVSPAVGAQLLVEDQLLTSAGSTPTATASTGAKVSWVMAAVAFSSGVTSAPAAPGSVVAAAGDSSATITWTAPATGGSPITSYTVTPYAGTTAGTPVVVTGNPPAPTATVTGLTNGTTYSFTVSATNAIGTGPAATSNTVVPQTQNGGSVSPLQTWPIVALANQLLYTGNIVAWDGWQQPEPTVYGDPTSPSTLGIVNAPDSVFCDGGATLPDGRLLVAGGYGHLTTGQLGIVDTNIFDPATNTWQRVADMHYPRWYPTLTELSDGRYLALSGNSTDANTWADTPEVYDPTTNTWTTLSRVNTSSVHEEEYPFSYELPNGNVFVIGPEEDDSQELDVNAQTWTSTGSTGFYNGSSVMYRPGKILYSGGAPNIDTNTAAEADTATIDLTAAHPTWTQTAPMNYARVYHTLTMLADGTVLAVGGSTTSDQEVITSGVLPTEIWNPDTQTWTTGASISAARNYHSTALLMPDGRVLIAGGGHPQGLQDKGQYSAQFYSPPYLSRGARPTITSAPGVATYGSTFSVTSPDASSITGVNLVSLGADTHQIDMNQHFVPLSYTSSGNSLQVTAPSSGTIAPPGFYMLFVLKNGVPSVAKMVQIGPSGMFSTAAAPTGVTAAAGNSSAHVSWTPPASNGGSPVTGYTITPYSGSTALPATTITGNPPASSATVSGLANGTGYTFTVAAVNAVGTGPASAASNSVTPTSTPPPAFVQAKSAIAANVSSEAVTLSTPAQSGDRLVVQVGVWNSAHATTRAVTDSAGNTYTEVSSTVGPDGTEQSVWTAPITAGAGAAVTVTAQTTSAADVGVSALEYSGLSSASGAAAVDISTSSSGTTAGSAATVSSGSTAAATSTDLAIGFYSDSGFGDQLSAGSGWTQRVNSSPDGRMEQLVQDRSLAAGATAAATFGTGAKTAWVATAVAFRAASGAGNSSHPATPSAVRALASNGSARLSWRAPADGGSAITGYTVTPYVAGVAQPPRHLPAVATSATLADLANGSSYNFTVTATNRLGAGPRSTLSNTVVPNARPVARFIQAARAGARGRTRLSTTAGAAFRVGDRLVVEVGVAGSRQARAASVTDAAGDRFTEVLRRRTSTGTELSVWTARVAARARPQVSVTSTRAAELGVAVAEYAGLAAGTPVDVRAAAGGTTTAAQPVSSGLTAPTSTAAGLAIGFYLDAGSRTVLSADAGYQPRLGRTRAGPAMFVEDAAVSRGATPSASIGTAARVRWLAATVVFRVA